MSMQRREFVALAAVAGAALLCQSAGFAEAADAKAAAMPDFLVASLASGAGAAGVGSHRAKEPLAG